MVWLFPVILLYHTQVPNPPAQSVTTWEPRGASCPSLPYSLNQPAPLFLEVGCASISSAVTQRTPCPQGTQTLSYHPDATLERSEREARNILVVFCLLVIIPSLLPKGFTSLPAPWGIHLEQCACPTPPMGQREGHTHPKLRATIQLASELLLQIHFHGSLLLLPPFSVFEACRVSPSGCPLKLAGSHTGITVLDLRTLIQGMAEWKCLGWRVTYNSNRESDKSHKL